MKKTILLALTLLTLKCSFGQLHIGFRGGLNLANVGNNKPDNAKWRTGLYAGGLLQVDLTDRLLLRPELLYSAKGFRTPPTRSSGKSTLNLNYISLPVLFGYRITGDLALLAGPEIGVLASARLAVDGNNIDVSDVYEKTDIGANLGIAFNMTNRLGVDVRYCYGFTKLVNITLTDQSGNIVGRGKVGGNRVFQLGLYYNIHK